MTVFEFILSLIAPHTCQGCTAEGRLLCDECAHRLPVVASRCYRCGQPTIDFYTCPSCASLTSLQQVWSVTEYDGLAKTVIHQLKFDRARDAAKDVARLMAHRLPEGDDWLVSHVPTAPQRARQRGYDQARLIAKHLASCLGRPYTSLLARQTSQRQVGHGRAVRRQQMRGAFRPLRQPQLRGQHILLVDDVLTTGATLEAADAVLRAAGAARVSAAVFAAVPFHGESELL